MSQVVELERAETTDVAPAPAPAFDRRLAIGVIVTGLVAFFGIGALEPTPHHEDTSWLLIAEIGSTLFFGLGCVGAIGLLHGRIRLGYAGLAGAAWVMLALVVGCPVSGHHTWGVWWAGQMALALAFATVSTVACAITRPRPGSRPTAA